jgi:uncharacterized protein YxjI
MASTPEHVGVSAAVQAPVADAPVSLDPAFDRDRFLLRQKILTVHEKYDVWDDQGQPILFVQRLGRYMRNLGAGAGGVTAGLVVGGGGGWLSIQLDSPLVMAAAGILGLVAIIIVGTALSAKRHLQFFRDDSKSEPLLEILQDQKFVLFTHTYTVNDPNGRTLARFSKNLLTDIFRKRWKCHDPSGQVMCVALEDSQLRALIRRFLTRLLPMNFHILHGQTGAVIGQFDRKFTLLDRYVLDLSGDPQRTLDRRVALALGVMLDTGERR